MFSVLGYLYIFFGYFSFGNTETFVAPMRTILFIFLTIQVPNCWGQLKDSVDLEEVMVTATRTERSISSVPMPVLVINQHEIRTSGSARLQDILQAQTGLQIVPQVNGLGNGLQLQGLNPDYVLILVDGEPLIGRYTGTIELSRITAHDIKKIEIVKGPSSSLYGSEALGGVINIITQYPQANQMNLALRYGSFDSWDGSVDYSFRNEKHGVSVFGNYFNTKAYDYSPEVYGQTVSPYSNYTLHGKWKYSPNYTHTFNFHSKIFNELQQVAYQVVTLNDSIRVSGRTFVSDYSIHPFYKYKLNNKTFVQVTSYYSKYITNTLLDNEKVNQVYYTDSFQQELIRPEIQATCYFSQNQKWTAGMGWVFEGIKTLRYGNDDQRTQNTKYIYAQHEWNIKEKLQLISGLRWDGSSVYSSQWSPKLAIQYNLNPIFTFKVSGGTGFKSPDFRYQYLNFRNAAAAYSVFGSEIVAKELEILNNDQQILQYLFDVDKIGTLSPERSVAINVGCNVKPISNINIDINLFRNDLNNLIETQAIAITKDLRTIYSYSNIKKAFTQGLEFNVQYMYNDNWTIQFGGQYLQAKDKNVQDQIEQGLVFGRDRETGGTYRIQTSDYIGLPQRSAHSENLKLNYTNATKGFSASFRMQFRGKFGTSSTAGSVAGTVRPASDVNGNSILDKYDNFVKAYPLFHITLSKKMFTHWDFQVGVDNIFNYTDALNIPNLVGRNIFGSIRYQMDFSKNKNNF